MFDHALPLPLKATAGPPESPKQVSVRASSWPAQNILFVTVRGFPVNEIQYFNLV